MNVAVLGFGTPALVFSRSCKAHGLSVFLLEPQCAPVDWQRYSSSLSGASNIDPGLLHTPEGLLRIGEFVRSVEARALMIADDKLMFWLAQNRELFEPACALLVASSVCLQQLSDKRNQLELAKAAGFHVLPTWYVGAQHETDQIPVLFYPVCVRPTALDSVEPNFKAEVLHTPIELKLFVQSLSVVRQQMIVQPFLDGPTLVVHGVRSSTGDSIATHAFLAYRKHEGFTLALKPVNIPKELSGHCRVFAEASQLTGAFHYELLLSSKDKRPYFLEVNARLGGTTDKVMRLGFDEPAALMKAFGIKLPRSGATAKRVVSRIIGKRLLIRSLKATLTNSRPEIDYPNTSRMSQLFFSLFALLFIRDSVLDWSDVRGSVWYLLFKKPHQVR